MGPLQRVFFLFFGFLLQRCFFSGKKKTIINYIVKNGYSIFLKGKLRDYGCCRVGRLGVRVHRWLRRVFVTPRQLFEWSTKGVF